MSSVSGYGECGQCGGVVSEHMDCRTGENSSSCMNCGKSHATYLERDKEGKRVIGLDGKTPVHTDDLPGFGAFALRWSGVPGGVSGPLAEPWAGDFEAFYSASFGEPRESVDEDESYVTSYHDGMVERVWGGLELPLYGDEERGYC